MRIFSVLGQIINYNRKNLFDFSLTHKQLKITTRLEELYSHSRVSLDQKFDFYVHILQFDVILLSARF